MVTGASSGIGEAYAELLAEGGWDLVLVARRRERLEQLSARLEAEHAISARVVEVDLANVAQLEALCAEALELALDLIVNNAGLAHYMPFADLPEEPARELVQLNVLAPVLLTRAVLPGMIARGDGIGRQRRLTAHVQRSVGGPFLLRRAVYAATKSFLVTFTEILALELSGSGVRAQVVCPGVVRSEFHTRQGMDMSAVERMEPRSVAVASLADLAHGVVVSIPGAADATLYDAVEVAQRGAHGRHAKRGASRALPRGGGDGGTWLRFGRRWKDVLEAEALTTRRAVQAASLCACARVSGCSSFHFQLSPFTVPGRFIRASLPSPRRSCAGMTTELVLDGEHVLQQRPVLTLPGCRSGGELRLVVPAPALPPPGERVRVVGRGVEDRVGTPVDVRDPGHHVHAGQVDSLAQCHHVRRDVTEILDDQRQATEPLRAASKNAIPGPSPQNPFAGSGSSSGSSQNFTRPRKWSIRRRSNSSSSRSSRASHHAKPSAAWAGQSNTGMPHR